MNKIILTGRLVRDPETSYTTNQPPLEVARFDLAVDRKYKKKEEQKADFFRCICFGKYAEFCSKYLKKGMKVNIQGRVQTGSYTNKDGFRVSTFDIVIEEIEFGESRNAAGNDTNPYMEQQRPNPCPDNEFMSVPEGVNDECPFA